MGKVCWKCTLGDSWGGRGLRRGQERSQGLIWYDCKAPRGPGPGVGAAGAVMVGAHPLTSFSLTTLLLCSRLYPCISFALTDEWLEILVSWDISAFPQTLPLGIIMGKVTASWDSPCTPLFKKIVTVFTISLLCRALLSRRNAGQDTSRGGFFLRTTVMQFFL